MTDTIALPRQLVQRVITVLDEVCHDELSYPLRTALAAPPPRVLAADWQALKWRELTMCECGDTFTDEMSPAFTDTARSALAWVLWHHQGASSKIGQAMRFALGMSATGRMNSQQIAEAKRWSVL